MALGWIQLDANLASHRKALHLAALLRDRRAWTYLVQLWAWASQNEPTGHIRGAAARLVVEQVAGWTGDAGAFADAAIAAGWIDVREDGLYIHDWHEHQGAHIANAEKAAERKRQGREKTRRRYGVHETSMGRPVDVHGTGAECPEDVLGKSKTNTKTKTNTEEKREAVPASSDPVTTSLRDVVEADFLRVKGAPYAWSQQDDNAVRALLRKGDTAEIERRWLVALEWVGFPACASLSDLAAKWNHYAKPQASGPPKRDASRGYVPAQTQKHVTTGYLPDDDEELDAAG